MPKPNGKQAALPEPWALPSVEVHLDKLRRVSFPMPAIFRYEDASGIDILSPPNKQLSQDKFLEWILGSTARKRAENVISLAWAGLAVEDPSLTREFIANHISMSNMQVVLTACLQALTMALPTSEVVRPIEPEAAAEEVEAEKQPA